MLDERLVLVKAETTSGEGLFKQIPLDTFFLGGSSSG